jgi:hypothetical protein
MQICLCWGCNARVVLHQGTNSHVFLQHKHYRSDMCAMQPTASMQPLASALGSDMTKLVCMPTGA